MNHLFITGASGFIGTEVLKFLTKQEDFKVFATDIRPLHVDVDTSRVTFIEADICSKELHSFVKEHQIQTILHLASIVTPGKNSSREFEYKVDVLGTKNILEAAIQAKVEKLIVTSSGAAYGYYPDNALPLTESDPIRGNEEFPYSSHKRQVEEMLATARKKHPQLKQLILRPGTVLGRHVKNQITNLFDKPFMFGIQGSDSPFVFIWDQDLVNIVIQGIKADIVGEYNIAGDGWLPMKELAKILNKPFFSIPAPLIQSALTIGHKLGLTRYKANQINFIRYRPVLGNEKLKTFYTPKYTSREAFLQYLNNFKRIFITGATSGLGLEMATRYLKDGHTVGTCSFENYDDVKDKLPAGLQYYQADVTNSQRMIEVVNEFNNKNNGLDLMLANAGISMEKSKIPDFDRGRKVIEINVIGVLNSFAPAISIMQKQGSGHLAALSSISGITGGIPGMAIYGASKAAVFSMCESMKMDLKEFGIDVTVLAPGFIKTPLTQNNHHKMPFIMSCEQACDHIQMALAKKKGFYAFPLVLRVISKLLRIVPRSIYIKIMSKDLMNTGSMRK